MADKIWGDSRWDPKGSGLPIWLFAQGGQVSVSNDPSVSKDRWALSWNTTGHGPCALTLVGEIPGELSAADVTITLEDGENVQLKWVYITIDEKAEPPLNGSLQGYGGHSGEPGIIIAEAPPPYPPPSTKPA